jgi:hypothetical protein
MHNPFIHRSIGVRQISASRYGVFAFDPIPRGTLIESCLIIPITKSTHTALTKTRTASSDKVFQNPDGILKERNLLNSIAEMELERRFDAGLLNADDIRKILLDSGNLKQIADVETHGFLAGYGSIYNRSQYPNAIIEYNPDSKLYDITTVKDIGSNTEITYFTR